MPLFYSEFFLMILHLGDICGRPTVCLRPWAYATRPFSLGPSPIPPILMSCPCSIHLLTHHLTPGFPKDAPLGVSHHPGVFLLWCLPPLYLFIIKFIHIPPSPSPSTPISQYENNLCLLNGHS